MNKRDGFAFIKISIIILFALAFGAGVRYYQEIYKLQSEKSNGKYDPYNLVKVELPVEEKIIGDRKIKCLESKTLGQIDKTEKMKFYLNDPRWNWKSAVNGSEVSFPSSQPGTAFFQTGSGNDSKTSVLTTKVTWPKDILYFEVYLGDTNALETDPFQIYWNDQLLVNFPPNLSMGLSTTTIPDIGPTDLSRFAGQTGVLSFVFSSTEKGRYLFVNELKFSYGLPYGIPCDSLR